MNSDMILQLNIITISIAIIALIFVALVVILIFILISVHSRYFKKMEHFLDRLGDISENLKTISSLASDEMERIDDSLENMHSVVDNVTDTAYGFTKFVKNIGSVKFDFRNIISSFMDILFRRMRKKDATVDDDKL